MLYEENMKQAMLVVLQDKMTGIANCIQALIENGYQPNRIKSIKLAWSSILIDAYENADVLSKEQHNKLDVIYNKVLKL